MERAVRAVGDVREGYNIIVGIFETRTGGGPLLPAFGDVFKKEMWVL